MIIRVNEVISIKIEGSKLRTLMSSSSCNVKLYSDPSSLTSKMLNAGMEAALASKGEPNNINPKIMSHFQLPRKLLEQSKPILS